MPVTHNITQHRAVQIVALGRTLWSVLSQVKQTWSISRRENRTSDWFRKLRCVCAVGTGKASLVCMHWKTVLCRLKRSRHRTTVSNSPRRLFPAGNDNNNNNNNRQRGRVELGAYMSMKSVPRLWWNETGSTLSKEWSNGPWLVSGRGYVDSGTPLCVLIRQCIQSSAGGEWC